MAWTKLWFGKHEGTTLPRVIFLDPDWFFWAVEGGVFKGKRKLEKEASEIYLKARHIKIPQIVEGEKLVAEYGFHPTSCKFADLEIVPASQPHHTGSTLTYRKGVIDLGIAREQAAYDKLGSRLLVKGVKSYLFDDESYRMTKRRCEEFFDDDDNFYLPFRVKSKPPNKVRKPKPLINF